MESVFHNFKFITFATQLILHIKYWLSFDIKYIICGEEIDSWNYRSGRIALSQIKQEQ